MQYYFVYILQSLQDGSFYVGQCRDLDGRISLHNEGKSKYTSSKMPWRLVYFELCATRSEAIRRERQLKSMKSRKYLLELISERKFF